MHVDPRAMSSHGRWVLVERLTKLRELHIGNTHLDKADIRRFESEMPQCKVSH